MFQITYVSHVSKTRFCFRWKKQQNNYVIQNHVPDSPKRNAPLGHNSWWGSTRFNSAFHPFIFPKSGKLTIIINLAVPRHFVAYLVFISSIRVDPGPRNRGPTSLLALKIRIPVANTGKLRSIGQVPVVNNRNKWEFCFWKLLHGTICAY